MHSVFDLPERGSLDDLFEQEQYWEFLATSARVRLPMSPAWFRLTAPVRSSCMVRPLSEAARVELFGVAQPGRGEFAPVANSERFDEYVNGGRWTGRAAVLWADGAPPRSPSGLFRTEARASTVSRCQRG